MLQGSQSENRGIIPVANKAKGKAGWVCSNTLSSGKGPEWEQGLPGM